MQEPEKLILPAYSLLLSWLFDEKKKLYEGVVEIFAHYTCSDLTLEMKLSVAGIIQPTVVLMLTCVSQWCLSHVILVRFTRFKAGVLHLRSHSLQVCKSLIMGNRSSFQRAKGQHTIYY